MRIIRLLFATFAFLWLCIALLRIFAAFNRPDALSYAIGGALVPALVFTFLAFGGRSSRRGRVSQKDLESKAVAPPLPPEQ